MVEPDKYAKVNKLRECAKQVDEYLSKNGIIQTIAPMNEQIAQQIAHSLVSLFSLIAVTVCFKGITTVRTKQMTQATKDMLWIFRIVNGLQQTNQLGHNKLLCIILDNLTYIICEVSRMGFYAEIEKSLEKAEASLKELQEIARLAKSMVTEEAKRSLKMRNFFSTVPKQLNPTTQHLFNQQYSKQYDQYSQLLTKQFAQKIEEKIIGLQDCRVKHLGEVRNKIKTGERKDKNEEDKKSQQQIEQAMEQLQKKIEQKKKQLQRVFKRQLNLMCNYRMDITAKEIERWSIGLQNQFNEQAVNKQIDDFFK